MSSIILILKLDANTAWALGLPKSVAHTDAAEVGHGLAYECTNLRITVNADYMLIRVL